VLQDGRYRTKVYLTTYLVAAQLTKDDDATQASFAIIYSVPPYSMEYEFIRDFRTGAKLGAGADTTIDLLFCIDKPTSKPIYSHDDAIEAYSEDITVHMYAIDQTDITGEYLIWKAEDEVRTAFLDHPFGSACIRTISETTKDDIQYDSTKIFGCKLTFNYLRLAT